MAMTDKVWVICKGDKVDKVFDSDQKAQIYIVDKNDSSYVLTEMKVD